MTTTNNSKIMESVTYNQLIESFGEIPSEKRIIIEQLTRSFSRWVTIENELSSVPKFEIDEKNPKHQRKLPAFDMFKEAQQRTSELSRALLREIGGGGGEESPLLKMLKEYRGDGE